MIIILFIIVTIFVILPPSRGKLLEYYDDNGDIVSGSISEKVYINIDGTEIGMIITAKDKTKPVLLFLSGGPGIPEYLLVNEYPTSLAEEFIVCYLDYRGTSLSYDKKLSADSMTTDSYLPDVFAVSEYLKERFHKDQIYLLGHSFGTYIGLLAAHQKPVLYKAYFAMSQITNQKESEIIAYNYMVENYALSDKTGMTKFEEPEKLLKF